MFKPDGARVRILPFWSCEVEHLSEAVNAEQVLSLSPYFLLLALLPLATLLKEELCRTASDGCCFDHSRIRPFPSVSLAGLCDFQMRVVRAARIEVHFGN